MTDPRPAEGPDREACGKDAGSRPFWMSPDQYDPCPCVRPKGHDGDHGCRDHDKPADDVALLPSPPAPGGGDTDLRAEVVTLCGSTRFKDAFHAENQRLTMEGKVVISLGVYGHTDLPDYDWTTDASDLKRTLDGLHFQKIDMADRVHVVNVGGYIGESTQREIAYARSRGLSVTFMDETAGAESQVRGGITPFSSRERLDGPPAPAAALAARPDADRDALARARVLLDDLAADNTMILAPGWMVRDAIVAKVRAALSRDAEGEA